MDSEKVLRIVEQLLQKQLTQIEQRVLILSWEGQSYKDIEENTGYVIGYLRDIGSNLWKELSEILQKRVTKKTCLWYWNNCRKTEIRCCQLILKLIPF